MFWCVYYLCLLARALTGQAIKKGTTSINIHRHKEAKGVLKNIPCTTSQKSVYYEDYMYYCPNVKLVMIKKGSCILLESKRIFTKKFLHLLTRSGFTAYHISRRAELLRCMS